MLVTTLNNFTESPRKLRHLYREVTFVYLRRKTSPPWLSCEKTSFGCYERLRGKNSITCTAWV